MAGFEVDALRVVVRGRIRTNGDEDTVTDLLRGNFTPAKPVVADTQAENERATFRKRALENISGSMVFVEDCVLYWDIAND